MASTGEFQPITGQQSKKWQAAHAQLSDCTTTAGNVWPSVRLSDEPAGTVPAAGEAGQPVVKRRRIGKPVDSTKAPEQSDAEASAPERYGPARLDNASDRTLSCSCN